MRIILGTLAILIFAGCGGDDGGSTGGSTSNPPENDGEGGNGSPAPNRAPVAGVVSVSGNEDHVLDGVLPGSDPDDDALTYAVTTPPAHGMVDLSESSFSYTPNANFFGEDEFQYDISDGSLTSNAGLVTLSVLPVNDPPVLEDIVGPSSVPSGQAVAIEVAWSDVDDSEVDVTAVQLFGTPVIALMVSEDHVEFTAPALQETEMLSFQVAISDRISLPVSSQFTVTVLAISDERIRFRLTEIGAQGSFYGSDLNESGHVTGGANMSTGQHAFAWNGETVIDIDSTGGPYSFGRAINNFGQVIGRLDRSSPYPGTAIDWGGFWWDGSQIHDLHEIIGVNPADVHIRSADSINDIGYIAGQLRRGPIPGKAFIWDTQHLNELGTLGGDWSAVTSINGVGQATGYSDTLNNEERHAFFWDGSAMHDLGTLGGIISGGSVINDAGHIAGSSWISDNSSIHAFFWTGAGLLDLGTLGGPQVEAFGLNNHGHIVGWSSRVDPTESNDPWWDSMRAFYWDGETLHDLTGLVDPADPLYGDVTLYQATSINDAGQVVAEGYSGFSWDEESSLEIPIQHLYLLTPMAAH
jgi:probable HAF family extracellular repeat protein